MDYKEPNLKSEVLTTEHMAHIEEGIDTVTAEVSKMKNAKIILRNDTADNWTTVEETVILLKGEPAVEFDEDKAVKIKIGDGVTIWKDLPYLTMDGSSSDIDFSTLTWGKLANTASRDPGTITASLGLNKIGYGDKVDVAALNTNADILEENIVAVKEQQITLNEETNILKSNVTTINAAIEEMRTVDTTIETAVVELGENTQNITNSLDERLIVVEDSIDRVDYLIGELSNESAVDVPTELIDLRIDIDGNTYQTAGGRVRSIEYSVKDLQENISDYIDVTVPTSLIYENNKLYLAANGEAISEPVEIVGGTGGGGSGGGGGSTYNVSLTNLLSARIFSVTKDEQVVLKFKYSSVDDDGYADGAGIGVLTINGIRKSSFSVPQQEQELNITEYLVVGENIVQIKVTNSEGSYRTLTYTVNVVALSLTTTFPNMGLYMGPVAFQYRVTGIGDKKVYFFLDDREIGSESITANDVTRTFNIGTQADGAHFLRVFVEATSDGITVTSNTLNIGLMWYSTATTVPMVMINYSGASKVQGEAISIPYLVYDPYHEIASITYNIYNEDGSIYLITYGQVDDVGKVWETQDYPVGNIKFEIVCEEQKASTTVVVAPSSFDEVIVQDGLALEFTAQNRSNYEENPGHWENNGYEATFSNFGWTGADGWVTDDNGHAVLRFLPGGEMYVPFFPFDTDVRASGYTIEVELSTHNVRDYDTTIMASYQEGRGIVVNSQNASLASEQSGVSVQFKEDGRVRLTFIVSQGGRRLIYIYINGILCGVTPYGETDNFKQPNPVGLTIGAENCGLDLYAMRFYNRALTTLEQLNNYICDRSTVTERVEADSRNDVLDLENSENKENILLSYDKVKAQIPVMIMECPELPQYKGDKKKNMRCEYIDQLHPEYSFVAEGVEFDVQGTSSAVYPVKNFKIKIKNGLTYVASGEEASGWLFDKENSIPTKTFCLKADYASSEHGNNVCLVDYYDETSPYKMPAQEIDPKVRQGVNGKPIMVFWRNSDTGELTCQGCYNMNDDKSNEKTFGFVDIDVTSIIPEPRIECWEWTNNNTDICLFKGADDFDAIATDDDGKPYPAWQNSLEPRFPDLDDHMYGEHEGEIDGIRAAIEWVISTDVAKATGEELAAPVQYKHYVSGLNTTFTIDNADYRRSKFKSEFEEYFILEAMLYFYLFTEVFLMIDNRAKNMFLTTFDGQHYFPIPYDMDTAMGMQDAR